MVKMIHNYENREIRTVWLRKTFDLKHGYGWHCQVYHKDYSIGYGFSKNKFTSYRIAVKEMNNESSTLQEKNMKIGILGNEYFPDKTDLRNMQQSISKIKAISIRTLDMNLNNDIKDEYQRMDNALEEIWDICNKINIKSIT